MTETTALVPLEAQPIHVIEAREREINNYLRPDEAHQLIEATTTPRNHLLLNILWQTGARISEIVGTRKPPIRPGIRPIDITDQGILIITLKQRFSKKKRNPTGTWVLRKTPTLFKETRRRMIPIKPELRAEIMEYCFRVSIKPDEQIFNISIERIEQILDECAGKTGITYKKIHPHLFRHGFAVNFLQQTGNIKNLQDILGHKHIQTTMQYLHLVPEDIRKAIGGMVF